MEKKAFGERMGTCLGHHLPILNHWVLGKPLSSLADTMASLMAIGIDTVIHIGGSLHAVKIKVCQLNLVNEVCICTSISDFSMYLNFLKIKVGIKKMYPY